jgi:predicted DNA-binding protein (UPF0251 family)
MPRPCKLRTVICNPQVSTFKPCGKGKENLETVYLSIDELEAVRLADYEGLYQEQAAAKMKVSRQTFGNIISSAHKKIADFLVNSKSLSVTGGNVKIDKCHFVCASCNHKWSIKKGMDKPQSCPNCQSIDFCCSKKIDNNQLNNKKCWRDL